DLVTGVQTCALPIFGSTELGTLSEKQLTLLRREKVGFIFQSYNLVPTLSAADNIALPLAIAGRKPDPKGFDDVITTMRLGDRLRSEERRVGKEGSAR